MKKPKVSRVLGLDPGQFNFGWAMVKTRTVKTRQFKVESAGKITSTISELHNPDQIKAFMAEFKELLALEPDVVCIERLILRRRIPKGVMVEVINYMIGLVCALCAHKNIPVVMLSAVVWKNAVKREGYDMTKIYKHLKIEAHLIDAVLQACYGYNSFLGEKTYFQTNPLALVEQLGTVN